LADQSDYVYRRRLQALLSVDDLVGDIVNKLTSLKLLDNTYIIYTSDNGFHMGQFGMPFDKRQLYEADIRVPMVIRGPGVTKNLVCHHSLLTVCQCCAMHVINQIVYICPCDICGIVIKQVAFDTALSLDIAPTIVDLATSSVPSAMDGRSLRPLLFPTQLAPVTIPASAPSSYYRSSNRHHDNDIYGGSDLRNEVITSLSLISPSASGISSSWRQSFLVEYWGEQETSTGQEICGSGTPVVKPCLCDEWYDHSSSYYVMLAPI
jgi:hypothetical protein